MNKLVRFIKMVPAEAKASYATEYQWYPGLSTWALRVYDRVLRKAPRVPLPARKRVIKTAFRDMKEPFFVRLGSSDLQLHQTIRFRGEYGPADKDMFGDVRTILDLGANAGFTIRLWREMFPDASIVGVEPDAGNLEVCRLNANSIPGAKVQLVQACVDGKPGKVHLNRSEAEHRFHIADMATDMTVEVEALTVPQVLERTGMEGEISLLKCDVQGAEQAIFADCRDWISRVRNMIVEVHPPYTPEMLLEDLLRNGWSYAKHVVHKTDDLWVLFFFAKDTAAGSKSSPSGKWN